MNTPNTPSKSVNAWIYLDEDDPSNTGYTSLNSSYQSLVNNKVYQCTDMLFVCFFAVVPDNQGYFTIEIGNKAKVHPDGSTTQQYLQYTIKDARAQKPGIPILATLNYNNNTLSQIFPADQSKWQAAVNAFAVNVKNYLLASNMNGLDIDWEGGFAYSITQQQFSLLFTAIRNAFNTASSYLYLTMCPAQTGNLDPQTVNTCFDMVNLQVYGGADPSDYTSLGISPLLMGYGAKFESEYQTADDAYQQAQQGFSYNSRQYIYNNITQWRLNSNNYIYEQSQQVLLYQFAYGLGGSAFNDGSIISNAGNPPITSLTVSAGNVLDSIQVNNSGTFNGNPGLFALLQHGGNGGTANTINISPGDLITQVSGYTGTWFGWSVVAQLTIKTKNGVTYGPFGSMSNVIAPTAFNYAAPAGKSIVAFNGSTVQVPEAGGGTALVIASLNVSFG